MIPKIIHYVWVGTAPKSDLVLKCLESWKKYCPDYTIREWNNEDVNKIKNAYMQEAFKCKKWAFVSDYLRLYALATEGGFYCDSDLEITNSIDKFRKHSFVTGYENWEGSVFHPVTAFMGAEKGDPVTKNLLAEYDNLHFLTNGVMDQTTNTKRISKYFEKKYNLLPPYDGTKTTYLDENSIIYPSSYFCTPEDGKENYSIHHFNASWVEPVAYSKKVLFKLGRFKLIKFKKKIKETKEKFPLMEKERILFSIKISKKKTICLVKKDKK